MVTAIIFARGGTQAAPDPQAEPTPLVQRPVEQPTPTQPLAPAAPQVAGAGKVLFKDTFDSPASDANWTAVDLQALSPDDQPARWQTKGGVLHQAWTGDIQAGRLAPTIAVAGSPDWTDYTYQASAYPEENIEIGVVFRRQGNSFYRVRMINDAYKDNPKLILEKVIDGTATTLASQPGPGYTPYHWYTFTITARGSHIEAKVNDAPALVADDSSLSKGQIGVYGFAIGQLGFDNVSVVAL
jgi:hypothetical protein